MSFTHYSYTVAWICALPVELAAAKVFLDEIHPPLPQPASDHNIYTLGSVSGHNVVVVGPPAGVTGVGYAAIMMGHLKSTYPNTQFGLLVGIGCGAPRENTDIRLGDVVVSRPTYTFDGIIKWDDRRSAQLGLFRQTGYKPPPIFLQAITRMQRINYLLGQASLTSLMSSNLHEFEMEAKRLFSRPSDDQLFQSGYFHVGNKLNCSACDRNQLVYRPKRTTEEPQIHYGTIASGTPVIKDARIRDRLARSNDILCFDMHAAGLVNQIPLLVIRGICDYYDSHKNQEWQSYAAFVAAAYARALLSVIPGPKRDLSEPEQACIISISSPEQESRYHNIYSATETCTWILENAQFKKWLTGLQTLIWIKGNPGAGKSVLMKFAHHYMTNGESGDLVVSYFMGRNESRLQMPLLGLFKALLSGILRSFPAYLSYLTKVFLDREKRLGSYHGGRWSWSEGELQQLISQILTGETMQRPVIIFVDGLDEAGAESARTLLLYFYYLIEEFKRKGGRVRICLSSRYFQIDAIPEARTIPTIRMERLNSKDIQRVVADYLRDISPNDTRQIYEKRILSESHESFPRAILLCDMVVRLFENGVSQKHILEGIFGESARIDANEPSQLVDTTTVGEARTFLSVADSGYSSLPTRSNKSNFHAGEVINSHYHAGYAGAESSDNIPCNDGATMDDVSIYTADLDIQPARKEAYISSFADNLLDKAFNVKTDRERVDKVQEALPGLLKAFALKVGSSEMTQIYRDVMVFVRKYRREIARNIEEKYIEEYSARIDVFGNSITRLQLENPVTNWTPALDLLEDPNTAPNEEPDDIMDDTDSEDLDEVEQATATLPEVSTYKAFITGLSAFQWLLESVQNMLHLDVPGDVTNHVKQHILENLPCAQRVSRREGPQRHTVTFKAEWDLGLFLREQEYPESPECAIERAVTITGSPLNAQAATTMQYLTQTWPSSGIHILHVLKHITRDSFTRPYSYRFPDRTQMRAWFQGPVFMAEVNGIAESIAEIGEQLAWLASSLRSSPYEMGVTVVSAFVGGIWAENDVGVDGETTSSFSCHLDFTLDAIDDSEEELDGQCWHQLFRNPVIVKGYPIPRRSIPTPGLEIALDTMAGLAGTPKVNFFSNRIVIKGFSTMLVPTRLSESIISWHLLYKKSGDRISYLESNEFHAENISLLDLEKSRHVLGWSSKVRNLAGNGSTPI